MSEANRYRAGLVGAGYISEYHIAALRRIPSVELVGLTDVNAAIAQTTGDKFGVKVFPTLEVMVRESGANVIHVLTPPHTHMDVSLKALELGCHLLVEKPLAEDVRDCEQIQKTADERGLKVCVNHSLLYDPQVRKALDAVRAGKIGKVVSMEVLRGHVFPPYEGGPLLPCYRTAGFPFRDIGIHILYLMQLFMGPIEHVKADYAFLGGDMDLAYDEWSAMVRCRDGMGHMQLSWNTKPLQSQMIICGTKGVMRVDLFLMFQSLRKSGPLPKPIERVGNAVTDSVKPLIDVPVNVFKFITKKIRPFHGLQDLVADFYHALENGKPIPVPVSDALPVIKWVEHVARAAEAEYKENLKALPIGNQADVLVTGASGALGSALLERLVSEGHKVRIFTRKPPKDLPEGVEIALGNLGDPEAVDRAVRGAKYVYHAGATMKGGLPEHMGGTVVGTKNVIESCVRHGVQKMVYVSSLSVMEWAGHPNVPIHEDSPYEPQPEARGAYTQAKLMAEKLVIEATQAGKIQSVILRPGMIFGRRLPLISPAFARKVGKKWLVLGNGKLRLPLVYMDDVVDALRMAMDSDLKSGEIMQLVDHESYTLTQDDILRMALGPNAKIAHLHRPILFPLGKFSEIALGALKKPSPLSVYRLKSALTYRQFKSDRAEKLLGWKPKVGLREGIKRSIPKR